MLTKRSIQLKVRKIQAEIKNKLASYGIFTQTRIIRAYYAVIKFTSANPGGRAV